MYFFTADQHYNHKRISEYCNRPFQTVQEMDNELIRRHNEVVKKEDTVIHAGDFAFVNATYKAMEYFNQLNGKHIYLKGSHDKWIPQFALQIFEKMIERQYVVVCHYCMKTWLRSHYNSWQLYGHSHGRLQPTGKQWDIGVDNNDFYPVSFNQLKDIMDNSPDNPNFIRK